MGKYIEFNLLESISAAFYSALYLNFLLRPFIDNILVFQFSNFLAIAVTGENKREYTAPLTKQTSRLLARSSPKIFNDKF